MHRDNRRYSVSTGELCTMVNFLSISKRCQKYIFSIVQYIPGTYNITQVSKSAFIVLAKERHSKGERVPFSAWHKLWQKLLIQAADTLSLMFKSFLEKNYRTPCNIPIRLISASPHLKEIATLFSKIITKSCKISPIFLQITTLLSKPCKILAIFTQITPTCPKSNRNLSKAYQIY